KMMDHVRGLVRGAVVRPEIENPVRAVDEFPAAVDEGHVGRRGIEADAVFAGHAARAAAATAGTTRSAAPTRATRSAPSRRGIEMAAGRVVVAARAVVEGDEHVHPQSAWRLAQHDLIAREAGVELRDDAFDF